MTVTQDYFPVGAYINNQFHFVLAVWRLGDEYTYIVCSNETGFDRQDMNIGAGGYFNPQISGFNIQGMVQSRRERGFANEGGI